jgi:hypothetical protein
MQDVFQDTSANGWLLVPAANLVEFVAAERKACGTTLRGYYSLGTLPHLITALVGHLPATAVQLRQSLGELATGAPSDAAFAQEEIDQGFATIFAHHTIAVWAAVETTLEQIVVSFLLRHPTARSRILAAAPTLKPGTIRTDTLPNAKRVVRRWQASLEDPSALGRTLEMLSALGFEATLPDKARRDLDEMGAVRNVMLHRAGFADAELLQRCPWFEVTKGARLTISQPMMDRYFDAASALAIGLIRAVANSPYMKVLP